VITSPTFVIIVGFQPLNLSSDEKLVSILCFSQIQLVRLYDAASKAKPGKAAAVEGDGEEADGGYAAEV
jgi:hypothetical protein